MKGNMHTKKKHRWLVAGPLIAVVVIVNVVHAASQIHALASVVHFPKEIRVPVTGESQVVQLPEATFRLEAGAVLDTTNPANPILTQGTALVSSEGLFPMG